MSYAAALYMSYAAPYMSCAAPNMSQYELRRSTLYELRSRTVSFLEGKMWLKDRLMCLYLIILDGLVTAEGTKLKFSEKIVKHAEEMKRKSMQIRIPKEALR
jgi:hypothetical protein